jgi:hypothetical protein
VILGDWLFQSWLVLFDLGPSAKGHAPRLGTKKYLAGSFLPIPWAFCERSRAAPLYKKSTLRVFTTGLAARDPSYNVGQKYHLHEAPKGVTKVAMVRKQVAKHYDTPKLPGYGTLFFNIFF